MTRNRTARILPALAVLAAGLALGAPPASAADPTCQGQPATIASDAPTVTGTEGPDVISVGRSTHQVRGLGGDDVVCAWSGTTIDAGAGNDSVVVAARTPEPASTVTDVSLGPGDDTYVGTDGIDQVDAFRSNGTPADPSGADTISTGGGSDRVQSGTPGQPNADRIDLGAGEDWADVVLPPGSNARITGGLDVDTFDVDLGVEATAWRVDLAGGEVANQTGTLASLSGMEGLVARGRADRLVVTGGEEANPVEVRGAFAALDVDLRGGDDQVTVVRPVPGQRGEISLGEGGSDLFSVSTAVRARVDLARQQVTVDTTPVGALDLQGVDDAFVSAPDVRVRGDHGRNRIEVEACRAVVRGLGGRDRLSVDNSAPDRQFVCRGQRSRDGLVRSRVRLGIVLLGGDGADRLIGVGGDDVLRGGRGFDRVDAGRGVDLCRAERKTRCER